jgi:predicted membrane chloride channel (bestrophin family)
MCMSSKPHSFLVSALGLLLVFRTNSAYQRFAVRNDLHVLYMFTFLPSLDLISQRSVPLYIFIE